MDTSYIDAYVDTHDAPDWCDYNDMRTGGAGTPRCTIETVDFDDEAPVTTLSRSGQSRGGGTVPLNDKTATYADAAAGILVAYL